MKSDPKLYEAQGGPDLDADTAAAKSAPKKKLAAPRIVKLKRSSDRRRPPASTEAMRQSAGKEKQKAAPTADTPKTARPDNPSAAILAAAKAIRERVPRQMHGPFKRDKAKVDPIAILRAQDKNRLKELVPIRYGRMLQTPFTFYRGSAAVMAADLAGTPATGIRVQACGDCHLMNFGGFATPERNILFDINDFDETLSAPWEWDIKRLVASLVLAARSIGLKESDGREAALACAATYRERLGEYSEMSPLEVWYARITVEDLLESTPAPIRKLFKARMKKRVAKATKAGSSEMVFPELTGMVSGKIRINDMPPLIFHHQDARTEEQFHADVELGLKRYRETLSDDRRELFDQYRHVDTAIKVVGIGSVGTQCAIILMMSANNDPLFLQFKEAGPSVLEPYAGKSHYPHHGQRVVMGQRLTQPASDMFLGWVSAVGGRVGYLRQLRDAKIKPLVEAFDATLLTQYAKFCGWALARAHAKAGGADLSISGYLGKTGNFDEAMGDFAIAYADQAERDHAALKAAVRAGKITVQIVE
jgi:uncharacterized protein (DUF2252 family)